MEGQKLLPKGRRDGSALWSVVSEDKFGNQWRKEGNSQAGLALQLHCIVDIPRKSELSCLLCNSGCRDGSCCQSDGVTQNCTQQIKNDMLSWCPKVQVSRRHAQLWIECIGALNL